MRLPFTNRQLAQIATMGAMFVGGNVVVMHYLVQKRFHMSGCFLAAARTVLSHPGLVGYLGEPVAFGNPNLSNKFNYSTPTQAQFEVPLKGSKMKGAMRFTAERKAPEETGEEVKTEQTSHESSADVNPWNLTSLEVIVDDRPNEKVVLVRKDGLKDKDVFGF